MKAVKEALSANAEAFETIELKSDGTAVKFEIELGAKSAEFDGHQYDHFSFEVQSDAKDPRVLRVGTYGCDFADVRPPNNGATYAGIGIENLTVFHRDGKEVGRAYYFLDGSYKPLFITVPPTGEYRSGN